MSSPVRGNQKKSLLSDTFETPTPTLTINRSAINALLSGRHAKIGGHSRAVRARNLLKIASSYTWDELLAESGIGPVTATEIKTWVERQGSSLSKAKPPC